MLIGLRSLGNQFGARPEDRTDRGLQAMQCTQTLLITAVLSLTAALERVTNLKFKNKTLASTKSNCLLQGLNKKGPGDDV